jgi:hypothetical protein
MNTALAADLGEGDVAINYAYAREQLEAAFYRKVTDSPFSGVTQREATLASRSEITKQPTAHSKYRGLFREIGEHEAGHVALLSSTLGTAAIKAPKFDFTAGDKYPDVFSSLRRSRCCHLPSKIQASRPSRGKLQSSMDTRPSDCASNSLCRSAPRRFSPRACRPVGLRRSVRQGNYQKRGSGSGQAVLLVIRPVRMHGFGGHPPDDLEV